MNLNEILEPHGLKVDDIKQIYYGGDHVCRCGCKGNYADRGTPTFTRYLNKIAKTPLAGPVEIADDKYWVNLPTETSTDIGKCFCLYFAED